MPFGNPILAGNTLNRTSMQSEDFVAGVSGWAIYRDGSAEFNDVVVRGDLFAIATNGAYVHVYNDATSGRIDLRPPNSSGTTIVPASISSSSTNPKSGEPALGIIGPTIDGNGPVAMYLSESATFGREFYLDADIFWLDSDAVEWNINGDWEITYEKSPGLFFIFFQVRSSDQACSAGHFEGGGFTSSGVTSTPNSFEGTAFHTGGTVDDDSLEVNFNVLSAQYELEHLYSMSTITLTSTSYIEISTAADVTFSKDCVDGLTDVVVRMWAGCRSSVASTVVGFGVRIKTFAGATIGDVDLFKTVCNTAAVHVYNGAAARVTSLGLVQNTLYKAHPIWKVISGTTPTVTMDTNDTLTLEIEEKHS
jgi:hypothetical protein